MANTYLQLNLHIVFSVKYRDSALSDEWRDDLFQYIGGIIRRNSHVPVSVGGWRDHIHIFIKAKPVIDIPSLVREIKLATNKWIQPRMRCRFAWQDGYGCFSISESHSDALKQYIANQQQHHQHISTDDEFRQLLMRNNVPFDERYVPVPDRH